MLISLSQWARFKDIARIEFIYRANQLGKVVAHVSVDTFLANFNVTLQGWYEKIAKVLKKVKIEVQDLSVQWQESHPKLTDVFKSIFEASLIGAYYTG